MFLAGRFYDVNYTKECASYSNNLKSLPGNANKFTSFVRHVSSTVRQQRSAGEEEDIVGL
jgi:hypothetical protein